MPGVPDLAVGPSVTGKYEPGGSIVCHAGAWTGADHYDFTVWRDRDGNGERDSKTEPLMTTALTGDGTGAAYAVQTSDLASPSVVGCLVTGRGPGGYAAYAAPSFTDLKVATQGPVATTPVTSAPTPTPTTVRDTIAPVISKSSSVCSATGCRLALVVIDRGSLTTTAGLGSVTFSLYLHRPAACASKRSARRTCVKTVVKVVRARRSIDQYVVQLTDLKRSERPRLRAIAIDKAGNRSIFSVALKLRTGR